MPKAASLDDSQSKYTTSTNKIALTYLTAQDEVEAACLKSLKSLQAFYQSKGRLEDVLAVEKIIDSFPASKSLPDDFDLERLKELVAIGIKLDRSKEAAGSVRDEQTLKLLSSYVKHLMGLQKKLVIADEIDEAVRTKAEIEAKKKLYAELRERIQLRRGTGRSGFDNLGFEKGLAGWKPYGDGHQVEPFVSDGGKPVEGKMAYQTSLGSGAIPPSQDALTNQLVSAVFLAPLRKANFSAYLWGGASDSMYVDLVSASNHKELCRLTKTVNGASWEQVKKSFRLSGSRRVYIRIVDKHSGGWGHLGVDRIEFLE
jgi:hypothetical protein